MHNAPASARRILFSVYQGVAPLKNMYDKQKGICKQKTEYSALRPRK